MKIIVTIEARMTSSRLPGKVLLQTCGKPMLHHMIERVRRSQYIDDVIVATTVNDEDDLIVDLCDSLNCNYYRGDEEDVLLRVLEAAKSVNGDVIVETTGDCPCIDWRHIDKLLDIYLNGEYDFVSNCTRRTFPNGFDIRILSTNMLESLNQLSSNPDDHEHVAIYFPLHPDEYRCYNLEAEGIERRPDIEVTLDEVGDYRLIDSVFSGLYPANYDFGCSDVIKYIDDNPLLLKNIEGIRRRDKF